ncbi:MAG TPA: diheme cytochrome c-553 [Polyangia bacterium]|nr:diheme cytochrome c-553 [Polyangia bacterium]
MSIASDFVGSRPLPLAAAAATLALSLGACTRPAPAPAAADPVARGRVLVSIGGCNDCHTPMKFDPEIGMPVPDMTRMLSGHPEGAPDPESTLAGHDNGAIGATFTSFRLPFGVVYSFNLTPDLETGLGRWTEDMFVRAVRTGRHMGGNGRPIMPPMPWPNLAQQSDDDLKAIFAYLHSIPAVHNDVPAPRVPEQAMAAIAGSYDKLLARFGAAAKAGHASAEAAAGPSVAQR